MTVRNRGYVPFLGVDEIIAATAAATGVSVADIRGASRRRHVSQARMLCMYIARRLTPLSSPWIGECLGRDHSSILNGARQIAYRRRRYRDLGDVRYRDLDRAAGEIIDDLTAAGERHRAESRRLIDNAIARLVSS